MKVVSRKYNNMEVIFDNSDSLYINATQIAKHFGKQASKWIENKETLAYINALYQKQNFANGELVVSRKGGNDKSLTGTWIHKKLIIAFARWLSPDFAVWCDEVIEEILQTGSYSLQKEETQNEKVSLQKSLETVETGIKLLKSLSNLNPMEKIELDKFYKIENGFSLLEKFGISFENQYFFANRNWKYNRNEWSRNQFDFREKRFSV
jgi:hypothetical protein